MPYTDTEPIIAVLIGQASAHTLQTIVAIFATAVFQLHYAGRKSHFIVRDQNFLWRQFVKLRNGTNRFAAVVHERYRNHQAQVMPQDRTAPHFSFEFAVQGQRNLELAGSSLTQSAPTLCRVRSYRGPGFAQTRNQFQCSGHWRSIPLGIRRFFRVISGWSVFCWRVVALYITTATALSCDAGYRNVSVTTEGQSNDAHALANYQIAEMHRGARFNFKHIDFDVLRQIRGQAGHFHLGEGFRQGTGLHLDAHTGFFVDEV